MLTTELTERERLPERRASETFDLSVSSVTYAATVSCFANGRLGEIFLASNKSGSAADTAARDSAIVCSIAVQFGADMATIRKALCRNGRGQATGPLGAAFNQLAERS